MQQPVPSTPPSSQGHLSNVSRTWLGLYMALALLASGIILDVKCQDCLSGRGYRPARL